MAEKGIKSEPTLKAATMTLAAIVEEMDSEHVSINTTSSTIGASEVMNARCHPDSNRETLMARVWKEEGSSSATSALKLSGST